MVFCIGAKVKKSLRTTHRRMGGRLKTRETMGKRKGRAVGSEKRRTNPLAATAWNVNSRSELTTWKRCHPPSLAFHFFYLSFYSFFSFLFSFSAPVSLYSLPFPHFIYIRRPRKTKLSEAVKRVGNTKYVL